MNKLILIIWIHFLADFVLQTDNIAKNKSKKMSVLALHGLIYLCPFFIFGWVYALINGIIHLMVDFASSKINSYFWSNNKRHWFFVTIGADQAIHITCLFLTLKLIT